MPQSSRTMVTLAACRFQRAASGTAAGWKAKAADAAAKRTSCFTESFMRAICSILVQAAAPRWLLSANAVDHGQSQPVDLGLTHCGHGNLRFGHEIAPEEEKVTKKEKRIAGPGPFPDGAGASKPCRRRSAG